jgi:CheY-like chemotaxis protein
MNAREAMPEGGLLRVSADNIDISANFGVLRPGRYVKISLADQGAGISENDFDKIFDPYFSTKSLGSKKGTGLGLSICQSIIGKHGGDVFIDSQVGKGTTVYLYLPATEEIATEEGIETKVAAGASVFGAGKILVMDDEALIRDLAGEILTYLGYEIEFAGNGSEAVELYRQAMNTDKPFDAVILDLTVRGGMGGKEAMQKLLEINPQVVGIVSSGYSDDPSVKDFHQYGFSGVVAKPYSMQELGQKLNQVLSKK